MRRLMPAAISLALGCGSWSCGGNGETEKDLRSAEMAIAEGDMNVARSVAGHLNNEGNTLTASQLARLSIVYMQLADHSDEDTNTAMAVNYCRAAMKENADSAEAYYSQLPPDLTGYGKALMMIVQHLDNPRELSDFYDSDSMAVANDSVAR